MSWWGGTPYPVCRRVIVTTKTDKSYRGLLWERKADYLVLREAEVLRERAEPLEMVGELMVYLSNIEYLQVLPGGTL